MNRSPAYPTLREVLAADYAQLLKWFRVLPSPGINAYRDGAAEETWRAAMKRECEILRVIGLGIWEHPQATRAVKPDCVKSDTPVHETGVK